MARRKASIDPNLFARTEGDDASTQAQKHESVQASKPESTTERKAATHYFDVSTLEALEQAWLEARARGESVSKSAIVEAALLAWLER